jgi:hypothetical protein
MHAVCSRILLLLGVLLLPTLHALARQASLGVVLALFEAS